VGKTCRLSIEMEVHKKRRKPLWDTDNLGIWVKAFNDTLKSRGYIEDDNYLYIKKSGGVEEFELPLNSTFDKLLAFNLHFVNL
jgi:Holliday junction resolvase RusA-like endonuclease